MMILTSTKLKETQNFVENPGANQEKGWKLQYEKPSTVLLVSHIFAKEKILDNEEKKPNFNYLFYHT